MYMMGKTHLFVGTGVTLSVLALANEKITLPVIAITAVSAILADIDEPNALLVSRAIPKQLIRLLQMLLIGLALVVFFAGSLYAPWNTVLAILLGSVSFMPTRTIRNIIMILIGITLIAYGNTFIPWNYIIGSILIICAIVPHRGLTHTIYGVIGWSILLFCATHTYGHTIWIAGGLSYLLHLLADALTNHGIRPLPPFKFRLKLPIMSTGTMKGSIVESICIGLTIILVLFSFLSGVTLTNLKL